jgi:phage terminase large subunit-like protein
MDMDAWGRQAAPEKFEGLSDCAHFVGLDLAAKRDLTARVSVYRRGFGDEAEYLVRGDYFVPEAQAELPENRHYVAWSEGGHLVLTPGNSLHFSAVREAIDLADDEVSVVQLAADEWGALQLADELQLDGMEVVIVPMRAKHLSDPMKWVDALVHDGRIWHDGNPVLTYGIGNVVAKADANDNIFPRKESAERKIDPAVALILAMSRALVVRERRSVYEERGLLSVEF